MNPRAAERAAYCSLRIEQIDVPPRGNSWARRLTNADESQCGWQTARFEFCEMQISEAVAQREGFGLPPALRFASSG